MNEIKVKEMERNNDRLRQTIRDLESENLDLKKTIELTRKYIEKAAKLKAVEYIVLSEGSYIKADKIALVLGITLPEQKE